MTECTGGSWATNAASNFVWDLQNLLIEPSRNWSKGSLYWSIALDPNGNPHVGGCAGCRGMVTVNSNGTYTKNEDYYAWGHFSKFVAPGAVRVDSTDLGAGSIETAAFRNPDGSIVLVALNSGSGSRTFQVRWNGQGFPYTLGGNAAATFKWTPGTGGGGGGIDSSAWYQVVNQNSNACVDDSAGGTANGTSVQQWACGAGNNNQQWQFRPTDSGYYNVLNRNAAAQNEVWDVTGGASATADGAKIQTWAYGGGSNQQWQPVSLGGGFYKLVARNSGKCLDVPAASTANGVQLQQYTCNGTAAQSFRLAQQP
jgi:glucosylceramidase